MRSKYSKIQLMAGLLALLLAFGNCTEGIYAGLADAANPKKKNGIFEGPGGLLLLWALLENRVCVPSITASRVYGQFGWFTIGYQNYGGISANSLSTPEGVTIDSVGGLYIADGSNSRVVYYTSGSTTATRVYGQSSFTTNIVVTPPTLSSLSMPVSVAIDKSNGIYVGDVNGARVLYYASGSTTASRVYSSGVASASSIAGGAYGMVTDSNNGLYIADKGYNRVLYFTPGSTTASRVYGQGGSFTTSTANNGGVSANSLSGPTGVTIDSSGGLYVTDSNNNRILYYTQGSTTASRVYGQGGSFATTTANNGGISENSLSNPSGVSIDSRGGLYVADTANNRILYYAPGSTTASRVYGQGGSFTTTAANNGGISAKSLAFGNPAGVAISKEGLYVTDVGNNRALYYPCQ